MLCHSILSFAQGNSNNNANNGQSKKQESQLFLTLDPKRKDLKPKDFVTKAKPNASDNGALNSNLGKPDDAERLLHRDPTPFEEIMYERGASDHLHLLHRTVVLTYSSSAERDKHFDKVGKHDGVVSVHKPSKIELSAYYPNESSDIAGHFLGGVGSESNVNKQWGLHLMRFPYAWAKSEGSAWITAVDSGLQTTHPDLVQNFRPHLSMNFRQPSRGSNVDAPTLNSEPSLAHGTHVAGILAAQSDNATAGNSRGVAGGCPECSLSMMKFFNDEQQLIQGIVKGVDNGAQVLNLSFETPRTIHKYCGPLTLAGFPNQVHGGSLCTALSYASQSGVAMAAAAGNHGNAKPLDTLATIKVEKHSPLYNLPAVHPDVMAVSGLTITNNSTYSAGSGAGIYQDDTSSGLRFWNGRYLNTSPFADWWGSNYGVVVNGVPQISFAAAAQQVVSTVPSALGYITTTGIYGADSGCDDFANAEVFNPDGTPNLTYPSNSDGIGHCTGTSMAAPHVAAAAGLVKSANPLLDNGATKSILARSANCLDLNSGKPCIESTPMNSYPGGPAVTGEAMRKLGYGVIQADKAVQLALGHAGAVNRTTPLFSHFQQSSDAPVNRSNTHFYTANPQMSMAAIRGTLVPSPRYQLTPSQFNCAPSGTACIISGSSLYLKSGNPVELRGPRGEGLNESHAPMIAFSSSLNSQPTTVEEALGLTPTFGAFPRLVMQDQQGQTQTGFANSINGFPNVTLKVHPLGTYPLTYASIGYAIPGYPYHPCGSLTEQNSVGTLTNLGLCNYWPARAVAMLLTTDINPTSTSTTLKKVYRISCAPEDSCNLSQDTNPNVVPDPGKKPYHVTFRYLSDKNQVDLLTNGQGTNTYKLDGVEGYVYDPTGPAPAGTLRLCSKRDPQQHDYVLQTEAVTVFPVCTGDVTVPHAVNPNGYTNEREFIGYVYPVGAPKALPVVPHSLTQTQMNGDTRADILWRNTLLGSDHYNKTSTWIMDNHKIMPGTQLIGAILDETWEIVGTGDFNGDGRTDVLWQKGSTLRVALTPSAPNSWLNAPTYIDNTITGGYKVVGVGDFNGDGKADILFVHPTTGVVLYWHMNGGAVQSGASYGTLPDNNWKVSAIGDFNGDGKADIYWRHASNGNTGVWMMNSAGTGIVGMNSYNVPDQNWKIVGKGDFNGDGKTDLLWWNHDTKMVVVWYMDGNTWSDYSILPIAVPSADWIVAATGDYNGDGITDILWRRNDGLSAIWFMNESTVNSWAVTEAFAPPEWTVQNKALP